MDGNIDCERSIDQGRPIDCDVDHGRSINGYIDRGRSIDPAKQGVLFYWRC